MLVTKQLLIPIDFHILYYGKKNTMEVNGIQKLLGFVFSRRKKFMQM